MSQNHTGNVLNSITAEEHATIANVDGKKVFVVDANGNIVNTFGGSMSGNVTVSYMASAATIYAVVNTAAAGESSIALDNSVAKIGFATTYPAQAWPDPKGYIGLVTITGSLAAAAGNVTLDPGSKTQIVGNMTLSDPKGYIGLVSVAQPLSTTFSGNVTISDSKGYIGLVTATPGSAWPDPKTFIGLVSVAGPLATSFTGNVTLDPGSKTGITGNVTLSDPKNYIGLTTTTLGASTANIGFATIANALAWPDPKTWIGFATVDVINSWPDPKAYIGLVTVGGMSTVTLADPKGYIGLVTIGGQFGWTYAFNSNASGMIVKSGAGMLHSITVGMPSLASTIIYDQTSPATPVLGALAVGILPGTYYYDVLFANGLTIKHAASAVLPQITIAYK